VTVDDAVAGFASESVLRESKLRAPGVRAGMVSRAALVERIRGAHRATVCVVETPPGFGKTIVAAELVQSERRPCGWYTLDELDNDPVTFLSYLAAAARRCGATVAHGFDGPLTAPAVDAAIEAIVRGVGSLPEPAVLVLDDVQVLHSRDCLRALAQIAAALPPRSQLVVLTRTPVDDTVAAELVLRADDLRLSDGEAHELVRAAGLELRDEELHALNVRCEGWATGLYLVALAGRSTFERVADETHLGVDRFISDYFRSELLANMEADDYRFLVAVSVLDHVGGALCDVVLGRSDSGARLAALARSNAFITALDDRGEWYRLHPLFRDALHAELLRTEPPPAAELTGRAIDWYEAAGDVEAAMECAVAAGARDRAAELVSRAALPAYWSGRSATLHRWLVAIDDPGLLAAHPPAAMLGAALMALEGRPQMSERWAHAFSQSDPAAVMVDGSPAAAWIDALRAFLGLDGTTAMQAAAERAIATLADESLLVPSAYLVRGACDVLLGDDVQALPHLTEAVEVAIARRANVGSSVGLAMLSLLHERRGNLRAATDAARRAEVIVDQASLDDYVTTSIVRIARARVALAHGSRTTARQEAERALTLAQQLTYGIAWLAVYTRLELAHLLLALEEPAQARALLTEIDDIAARRPDIGSSVLVEALRRDFETGRSEEDGWVSPLTPAELRLLPLLATYHSFREIADRLGISRNTVKTQAISVYRKLDVSSRSEAVERARELGLLQRDQSQI
jgi:LuxR family transcriptional regulator, maltose regulon positive regulatory protein